MGSVKVVPLFTSKKYTFVMNPTQFILISVFNNQDRVKIKDLIGMYDIDEVKLKSNLIPFFNPRKKLLLKDSPGKKLNNNEFISLNLEFFSEMLQVDYKFKPKFVSSAKTPGVMGSSMKYILDSHIIKIMKSKRSIHHESLIKEVFSTWSKSTITASEIKERLENLIEREFIGRDELNSECYHYIEI